VAVQWPAEPHDVEVTWEFPWMSKAARPGTRAAWLHPLAAVAAWAAGTAPLAAAPAASTDIARSPVQIEDHRPMTVRSQHDFQHQGTYGVPQVSASGAALDSHGKGLFTGYDAHQLKAVQVG
jgi:hypothetical protein